MLAAGEALTTVTATRLEEAADGYSAVQTRAHALPRGIELLEQDRAAARAALAALQRANPLQAANPGLGRKGSVAAPRTATPQTPRNAAATQPQRSCKAAAAPQRPQLPVASQLRRAR